MGKNSWKRFNEGASLICEGVYCDLRFEVHLCDIFVLEAEAIVNPANKRLDHIGGLAAQISQMAGPLFQRECERRCPRGLREGEILITDAYNLKEKGYKNIINAVGEIYEKNMHITLQNKKLTDTIEKCLIEANSAGIRSISFPAISCGIFNYPIDQAAICHFKGFISAAKNLTKKNKVLKIAKFALFNNEEAKTFSNYFLSQSDSCSEFRYFDLPENRKCRKYICCGGCKIFYKKKFFSIFPCCTAFCNFCILKYQLTYCLRCKNANNYSIENVIWCRECLQEVELTKRTKDRTCNHCHNICYYHYIPKGVCMYCKSPYS